MRSGTAAPFFPTCTRGERLADTLVHALGVAAAPVGASWLLWTAAEHSPTRALASLGIYSFGLIGMLWASAAYHVTPPGSRKEILRRLDHAMIYVMIAGSYTPIAMNTLAGLDAAAIGGLVWIGAVSGATIKIAMPRRWEGLGLLLYLGLGWAIVTELDTLRENLSPQGFTLLIAGGIIYTFGAVIHHLDRLPYHTALWHVLVLVAAGCHFAAFSIEFALPA